MGRNTMLKSWTVVFVWVCFIASAAAEETAAPAEETATPAEETATSAEETATPAEETVTSEEEAATSAEDAAAPAEDAAASAEETAAPAEEATASAEETAAPAEETATSAEDAAAPAEDESKPVENAEKKKADRRAWRKDKTLRRRPGSYLGGGLAYARGNAWYTVKLRDLVEDYDIGPVHGYLMAIRVGDAFFDWLAAGFQIDMLNAALAGVDEPGASCMGLYVDVTFYPWRGLGLRPSLGVGFGFAQAGKEIYEIGVGGPLTLAFTASYEFRVSRFFTMGPFVQVAWVRGEDFDSLFLNMGLEFLKWFRTAEG